MLLDKNFLIGVGLGIAAGAVGYKLYNEHRQTILESLDNLKNRMCPGVGSEVAVTEQQTTEIDLAELEKQKEHLEDLIAEQQMKQAEQNASKA
jgi:predicted small secreted protein